MSDHGESGSSKDVHKLTVLLSYYGEQRNEIRLYSLLGIICIVLSVLTPSIILVGGVFSNGYVLYLISPALSIFFAILTLAIGSYQNMLVLKLGDTEDNLNKLIGEPFLQYSFRTYERPDVFEKRIIKYWLRVVSLGMVVGLVPFIMSLWLGINLLFVQIGILAFLVAAAYGAVAVITLYLGLDFFIRLRYLRVV